MSKNFNRVEKGLNLRAQPSAPSDPVDGDIYYDTGLNRFRFYENGAWNTLGAGAGDAIPPVGTIIAYAPGYFNLAGTVYTNVGPATNTVADVNSFLPSNWRVCDGTQLNDPDSVIFNGVGRYLPNLTDSRFIRGFTEVGIKALASATFTGTPEARSAWAAGGTFTPTGTVSGHTHTTTAAALNSAQGDHYHTTPVGSDGTNTQGYMKSLGTGQQVISGNSIGGLISNSSLTITGPINSWLTGPGEANFLSNVVSGSTTPTWTSTTNSARSTWFAATNYTPSGTISSVTPTYLSAFYIMRVK